MDPSHLSALPPPQPQVHIPPNAMKHNPVCYNLDHQFQQQDRHHHQRKKLILCFDGTGNKFKGNAGDTNILKIFRMLDRSGGQQFHYYQPGIGTYITNGTLSRVHIGSRFKSWVNKAVDAAVGTSFDQHVVGGYKFIMRYYAPGDDIYLFGFSRGAYTARFLSEMLDHVGLVSQGNEEMVMFAWKTFSNWQQRVNCRKKKEEMYNYMRAFRETFARPVRRVRFLGLFDTVNAVPRFEDAWLKRSKGFPYTARSTARVIRHAVGIDERRAKFRQDLVEKVDTAEVARRRSFRTIGKKKKKKDEAQAKKASSAEKKSAKVISRGRTKIKIGTTPRSANRETSPRYSAASSDRLSVRSRSRESIESLEARIEYESDSDDEDDEQDIEELWFPGAHGDIGGGWDLPENEEPLSHGPLVWMVREACKAGVVFDKTKMKNLNCWLDEYGDNSAESSPANSPTSSTPIPQISVQPDTPTNTLPETPPTPMTTPPNGLAFLDSTKPSEDPTAGIPTTAATSSEFLLRSYTHGKIHDCLRFGQGLYWTGTLGWKMMEWLPFRRMDLQPDGSWKPITWPLPRGEVRDIPDNVKIHSSVLRRMESDPKYRPGNLIIGGGGRGVRVAPKEYGIGEWVVVREEGSLVGEVLMKKSFVEKSSNQEMLSKQRETDFGNEMRFGRPSNQ